MNVYNTDLSSAFHIESDLDTDRAGEYTVTASVSDTHGNAIEKQAHIRVVEGEKETFGETVNFSLLEGRKEKQYQTGYLFKGNSFPQGCWWYRRERTGCLKQRPGSSAR